MRMKKRKRKEKREERRKERWTAKAATGGLVDEI